MPEAKKKRGRINSPIGIEPTDLGYLRQCGFALEPSLDRLIELAVEAGWSRQDVVAAILVVMGRGLDRNWFRLEKVDGVGSPSFEETDFGDPDRLH